MQQLQGYGLSSADQEPGLAPDLEERTLEPGGFAIRFAAHFVDMLATVIAAFVGGAGGGVLVAILGSTGALSEGWQARIGQQSISTYVFALVASLVYHTLAVGLGGATVGKAVCGLRVLTTEHQPCTVGKALGRSLAFYLDAQFFGLVAWTAMSKSRLLQRYGDRWAGTIVVHTRSTTGMSLRSPVAGILLALTASSACSFASVLFKAI